MWGLDYDPGRTLLLQAFDFTLRRFHRRLPLDFAALCFKSFPSQERPGRIGGKEPTLPHRIKRDINIRDIRVITDLATEEEWNDIYEDILEDWSSTTQHDERD